MPASTGALRRIVADYLNNIAPRAEQELSYFSSLPTVDDAIRAAALALRPDGKRLSHQRRIPRSALEESASRLLQGRHLIVRAKSFEQLHEVVTATIGSIRSVGRLTIYDTALRIGAKLGRWPNQVFLHAGTRVGAARLGLETSSEFLSPATLPAPLQDLKPHQVEDVLCIYKDDFITNAGMTRRQSCAVLRRRDC